MAPKKEGYLFIVAIVVFSILVSLLSYSMAYTHPFELSVRLFALNGFLALSIATIMTPFLGEVKNTFQKSFTTVHHSFAAIGITLATLHPVAFAIQVANPAVFLPNLQSWYLFWLLAGRQGLIILYVAAIAALLRRKIPKFWRPIHAFMYVVLFFAVVHANLLGVDFQNPLISAIFNSLFAASVVVFGLKRLQQCRRRQLRTR